MGLASTTTRSGACENMLETPGVLGLPAGVLARLSRAGVFAPPGVFPEGVLALFIHDAGRLAENVLPGVFASADVDGSSDAIGSVAAPAMAAAAAAARGWSPRGSRRAVCGPRAVGARELFSRNRRPFQRSPFPSFDTRLEMGDRPIPWSDRMEPVLALTRARSGGRTHSRTSVDGRVSWIQRRARARGRSRVRARVAEKEKERERWRRRNRRRLRRRRMPRPGPRPRRRAPRAPRARRASRRRRSTSCPSCSAT